MTNEKGGGLKYSSPPRPSSIRNSAFCILHSRRRGPAFTLLELVLVMALLTVIVAIVVPSLRDFGRGRKSDDCAAQIVSVTQWARAQAVSRGEPYRLNLDSQNGTFWLTVQPPEGTEFVELGEEFGRVFTAPDGVKVAWEIPQQEDGQYVEFLPSGRISPAPAIIRVIDAATGFETVVACQSSTEPFRVLKDVPPPR